VTATFPAATAALERLDAALDPRDFATTLTTSPGQPPCLAVTCRHASIGDDIYADYRAYWWSWSERIGPLGDPAGAARKIAATLCVIPRPSNG
jgi:hypothetical protein